MGYGIDCSIFNVQRLLDERAPGLGPAPVVPKPKLGSLAADGTILPSDGRGGGGRQMAATIFG